MSAGSIARHLILFLTALWIFEAAATELTGTAWRLVKIMSMDDRVYAPDDRSKYTLELLSKGRAAIEADCNLGTGTWTSEGPGQLKFGPIATTRALYPPESLSERYLAQFDWVRSYVMEDGRLFLATMADGSIIEFEPINVPPTATVLGEEVHTTEASELQKNAFLLPARQRGRGPGTHNALVDTGGGKRITQKLYGSTRGCNTHEH